MKISVIGYSGAGKSTLARRLSEHYGIDVMHLDKVQFMSGWQERPLEDGRQIVQDFMQRDNWVIDGNYGKFFQAERFSQSDMIIFLDFGRIFCLRSAFSRYLKYRGKTRDDMADGCFEKFDFEFFRWIVHEGRTKARRENYERICREHSGKLIRLKSRREAEQFLHTLA